MEEKILFLHIGDKNYSDLASVVRLYSSKNGYHVTESTLNGSSSKTSNYAIMMEGRGVRVLFQNALSEKCIEREGRRDVEYSQKLFDINAFSTSHFLSNSDLPEQVARLKDSLTSNGFRIVSKSESCDLL